MLQESSRLLFRVTGDVSAYGPFSVEGCTRIERGGWWGMGAGEIQESGGGGETQRES